MSRAAAAFVSVALVGAAAAPVLRAPTADSFPLSTYPMFAAPRPTTLTVDYPLGATTAGARRTLAPTLVGSPEILQALTTVARARQAGALPALCAAIAARVAADPARADVATIRVVTGTHDAVGYLVRGELGREIERARCAVVRGAAP